MQIKADVLGQTIYAVHMKQATGYGATMLHQYVNDNGNSVHSNIEFTVYSPNMEKHKHFCVIYKEYKQYYDFIHKQVKLGGQ